MIDTTAAPTISTEEQETSLLGITIIIVLLGLCGLVGNAIVIWLLRFGIKKSPYSVYIFNLAIADFLFLLCTVLSGVLHRPEFGFWANYVSEVFLRISFLVYTLGLSLLATISLQRCLSVLFPIWYQNHRPKHLSSLVCTILWILAILENLVAIYFCVMRKDYRDLCHSIDWFFAIVILGVFTPLMCASSLILFIKVQKFSKRRKEKRLYIIILITTLVFLICALPLTVYWFILYWITMDRRLKKIFFDVATIFSCVNSTANPIIYFMVGSQNKRRFHEPLKVVLKRALWEEEMSPPETIRLG
ncbi:mas-related G-protein coupled receptor member D [Macrotis lagotis]|uniref:mas-related G-protein coupled receptor member D n=1 Tax=Macrotis lagotis TaxID=92651 RepID=UPI003D682D7D